MPTQNCGQRFAPLTVVIATLGGAQLKDTIEALNKGSIIPNEILICIPAEEASRVQNLVDKNIRVFVTNFRGQVAQRAAGFQNAQNTIVMQLDDDMLVDEYCVEHLLGTLNKFGDKVAVAPALISLPTRESIYKKPQKNLLLLEFYYWLMNGKAGYQPGKINKSGSPNGVDPQSENKEVIDVEWLAGGCVMHYRKNLLTDNFYPFKGKAYCEDLIHSYYLRAKGVRLLVDSEAFCGVDLMHSEQMGLLGYLKSVFSDFRARYFFMRLSSRGTLRMYIFYLVSGFSYFYKRIRFHLRSLRIRFTH